MASQRSNCELAGSRYREAGVDIDRAEQSLSAIRRMARSTLTVAHDQGEIGHFGGVFPLPAGPGRLLVASADGIGTKIKLAFVLGGPAHARVGADLVNHCVNDILACGARPLFFLDYVAMGQIDPAALEGLVEGMSTACRESGVALIGGETAEMPGLYAVGEYDAAGFIVGEVAEDNYVDGHEVDAGDQLLGFPALGLHTNGFSLARHILGLTGEAELDREILAKLVAGSGGASYADALLAPHPSYLTRVLPLIEAGLVRGMAHITGGGLADNVPRMIPDGLQAVIDTSTWSPNPVFRDLVERGDISMSERYRVFNMGIGFVLAVRPEDVSAIRTIAPEVIGIGSVSRPDDGEESRIRLLHG